MADATRTWVKVFGEWQASKKRNVEELADYTKRMDSGKCDDRYERDQALLLN
jgi:hypothetical protein